jgi:hypothetical protein
LQIKPEPTIIPAWMSHRVGCSCITRSTNVHRKMIAGSRYGRLSNE